MGSKLEQLLSYLRRDDVIQLRFRSDEPVMLHTTQRAHAVTVSALTAPQIRRFFEDTEVAARLASAAEGRSRDTVSLAGIKHDVEVSNLGDALSVSVRLDDPVEDAPMARPQPETRDDVRAARTTAQSPAAEVAQPTVHPTPTFTPVTPIPQGGIHGQPASVSANAQLTAILIAARGRRARQVLLSPEHAVQLRIGGAWVNGGTTLSSKDIEGGLRSLLELRHHERLASRGHVSRTVEMGGAGRWNLRVLRQSGELRLCLDSVLNAAPEIGGALEASPITSWMQQGHGLCVITGPPGAGKTTALASLAAAASAAQLQRVAWVSGRCDFDMQGLGTATTWFEAWPPSRCWVPTVRAAVDQSPDALVVDGLRDAETAAEVVRAASARTRVLVGLDAASITDGLRRLVRLVEAGGVHDAADLVAHAIRFAATPTWREVGSDDEAQLHLRLAEASSPIQSAIRSGARIALELAEQDLAQSVSGVPR